MCAEVTCKQCGRPAWKGCGQHVEQRLGNVAQESRCQRKVQGAVKKLRSFGR